MCRFVGDYSSCQLGQGREREALASDHREASAPERPGDAQQWGAERLRGQSARSDCVDHLGDGQQWLSAVSAR